MAFTAPSLLPLSAAAHTLTALGDWHSYAFLELLYSGVFDSRYPSRHSLRLVLLFVVQHSSHGMHTRRKGARIGLRLVHIDLGRADLLGRGKL